MKINRRAVLLGGLGATALAPAVGAQDITFFRIGTGGTAGTYFPIGGLIANAISNPPGSRTCADGGSCGVPRWLGRYRTFISPCHPLHRNSPLTGAIQELA